MKLDPVRQIQAFNTRRDPERLAMKYDAMRANAFVFLRGTCHLFYDRLPDASVLRKAPLAWVCGDLHLENFGSYKGDNRLSYFDINDFDEAALAPASWDLLRFVTSVRVAADSLGMSTERAQGLAQAYLQSYSQALTSGKSRWIERDTAEGAIADLLNALKGRKREDFLAKRTVMQGKRRRLNVGNGKALPATGEQRACVEHFMRDFAQTQAQPAFFKVMDVARRIAGTGSLGCERYVVLVAGEGKANGNYLLDLKAAPKSSLLPHLDGKQPKWASQAHRVVSLQQRAQAVPMAFLQAVHLGNTAFVLRELQPSEDRLALDDVQRRPKLLRQAIETMGKITAWSHLRCAGHGGSAIVDELSDWGSQPKWQAKLLRTSLACARQVEKDWQRYCQAFDDGLLATK